MGQHNTEPGPYSVRDRLGISLFALLAALLAFWGVGWLILAVPGLLFLSQRSLPLKARLLSSLLWGFCFAGIYYFWALHYGWLPWLALVLVRGLPWLVFALPSFFLDATRPDANACLRFLACGAGYWAVTVLLLLGPTGADWETPLACLTDWPWSLSLLPWLGLAGGAFLLGTCSAALFSFQKRGFLGGGILLLTWFGLSAYLFQQNPSSLPDTSLALVQTGWEQDIKWDEDNVRMARQRLVELTEQAAYQGARLVIWPETAWPHMGMRRRPGDTRAIGRLARRLGVDILASSIEVVPEGWFNSVSQVLASGRFGAEYKKRRLAPFAEYIPLPQRHEKRLREIQPFNHISPYLPGRERSMFEIGDSKYGVLICYESMIAGPSDEISALVDFLVIVTNDAPFRAEAPKEAHFRSAILRAIEFQLPVVQAANNGVTGIIDSKGRVIDRTEPGFSGPIVKLFRPVRDSAVEAEGT